MIRWFYPWSFSFNGRQPIGKVDGSSSCIFTFLESKGCLTIDGIDVCSAVFYCKATGDENEGDADIKVSFCSS